jgi:hypothetical protein
VLWVATIFIGSGLLFAVQPMIARMLLPRLGGAPSVWTVSVLFFQSALLAGYAYAHWISRRAPAAQLATHAALLLAALAALPFHLAGGAPGVGTLAPALWLLRALLLAVGFPFFVLAAGAPLLQRWRTWSPHPAAADPYFLYSASNAGSLLALCAYPVLIEPALGLARQRIVWAGGYVVYALLALACAARTWKDLPGAANVAHRGEPSTGAALPLGERLMWILLSAAPASLMLGITSVVTADAAAVPFLWVLPLALYLLTFALAFSRGARWPARLSARLPIAAVVFMLLWMTKATEPLPFVLLAYLAVLFVGALAGHGELARRRPPPRHLTAYYLLVAAGGVIGGAFNTLLAPNLFHDWVEVPLAFTLVCIAIALASREATDRRITAGDIAIPVVLALATALVVVLGDRLGAAGRMREVLTAGLPALLAYVASNRALRFGLAVGAVLLAGSLDTGVRGPALLTERSFFGVHHVTRSAALELGVPASFHRLYHGTTIHGVQRADVATGAPIDPRDALGYYSIGSPIGWLFRSFRPGAVPRVGVVGLGAGCLLAYAEPGQRWTLFEIDPLVKRIAEDERYFSYLPEARRRGVEAEVVLGDARLTLATATGPFDLIVLDAFTSGSIPVHLLTREAFQLYEDRLAPEGVLAFHISNRHLDLAPLMRAMARDRGLAAVIEEDFSPPSPTSPTMGSRWAFLARSADHLPAHGPASGEPPPEPAARVWTDDRSDAWSLFQW